MKGKNEKKEDKEKDSGIVTRESISAVGALFSLLALFILITRRWVFGEIGVAVSSFLWGVFGWLAVPLLVCVLYLSVTSFLGKRLVKNRKAFTAVAIAAVCLVLILHVALTYRWELSGYLSRCFNEPFKSAEERSLFCTPAGWLGALIVYPLRKLTTNVGAIVILSALFLLSCYLSFCFLRKRTLKKKEQSAPETEGSSPAAPTGREAQTPYTPYNTYAPSEPLAPTGREAQTPYTPYNTYDNTYAPTEPSAPPSPYMATPEIRQRPGVNLTSGGYRPAEQPQERTPNAFSPFGMYTPDAPARSSAQKELSNKEFLFGGSPAEIYQKNLIFDSNANVNKRPPIDPEQPTLYDSSFTRSYAAAYEKSINDDGSRPTKVFTDNVQEKKEYDFPQSNSDNAPLSYRSSSSEEPVRPTNVSFPEPNFPESTTPSIERETDKPAENTERFSRDLRNIFSDPAPNIFGLQDEEVTPNNGERMTDRRDIFDEEEEKDDPYALRSDFSSNTENTDFDDRSRGGRPSSRADKFDPSVSGTEQKPPEEPTRRDIFDGEDASRRDIFAKTPDPVPKSEPTPPPPAPQPRVHLPYQPVPIDYFDCRDVEPDENEAEAEKTKRTILETLDAFRINDATIASVTYGPTVTRYNVVIPRNISAKKVVALDQDIAMSLYASKGVNIYPNFEDGAVSIEVPNKKRQFVQLGCMLTGEGYTKAKSGSLIFAMGKDVGNRKIYGDICKMTHLLVAGASGSGKSVFLRSLIISLLVKYSPDELRLILIDPKKTEFVLYDHLPHLMIDEILTDINKVIQSLNWAIGEMNRRYGLFEQKSRSGKYVVNIDEYNNSLTQGEEKLPKIVIIVDELADLMLSAKKDIEDRIQNLTQKSRAAGIHLIIATQRPSADVITGVIKANLPTRIAFAVASEVDSRVILDMTGAQKLLGKGDLLYLMAGMSSPTRVQGASIESEDAQKVVTYIKEHNEANFDESASAFINNTKPSKEDEDDSEDDGLEPVYIDALRYVILSGSASISMIQRKCSVGFNKAGKIIEWMEDMGYISAFDGAKSRKVLITKEDFESKYGEL